MLYGFSLQWLLLFWSMGSKHLSSLVVAHKPSCPTAGGIFPDQGLIHVPCIGRQIPNHWHTRKFPKLLFDTSCVLSNPSQSTEQGEMKEVKVKVAQLYPTLCDPMNYTVHGILQARTLERVGVPFSSGLSQPRHQTQVSCTAGGFFTS